MAIGQSRRENLWFGTVERAGWFPTPNRGADMSSTGWDAEGTLLNGGGWARNSWGSHKRYIFEWPSSSSREVAMKMKAYADGSYGRGLIYFHDPLSFDMNVLPALWADPSIGVGYDGASLVYGLLPERVPTGSTQWDLPVNSAQYNLNDIPSGFRGVEDALFVPIPAGYTLLLGAFYSSSGTGGVFASPQLPGGGVGSAIKLTEQSTSHSVAVSDSFEAVPGVWLWVGKSSSVNSTVLLRGMVGRLIPSVKAQSTMVAQNLFTNPNLVGDGTYAEVSRNLFTNPNLVGDGTWAEVRRNRAINPIATSAAGGWSMDWGTGGTGEQTFHGSWGAIEQPVSRGTVTATPSAGDVRMQVTSTGSDIPVTPGETIRILIRVGCDVPVRLSADLRLGNTYVSSTNSPYATRDYGAAEWVEWETIVPAGVDNMRLFVQPHPSPVDVGTRLVTGALMVGDGDYFDGSTADRTVDPDMRQQWLGAPNASESVMEIEQVAGLTATNCVAGVSTRDGKPAVRLIPTGASSLSYAWSSIPIEARTSGTALGTLYLDEPVTGSLNTDALSIRVHTPTQRESAPNMAGEHPLRLKFSGITSGNTLRLYHGGAQGSGDVWWTDIGLFAGDYDGPAFSGDTTPTDVADQITQPEDFRWRWLGTPNESESVMEIERVRGLTGFNVIAGVSTREGKPAVRVIPTGTGVSGAYTLIPVAVSSVTAVGTVSLDAPLQGTLNELALSLEAGGARVTAPNLAGDHPLRVMGVSYPGSDVMIQFIHGGTQGSGDVWWTNIGLFAGEYDGPAFAGDSSGVVINGRNMRTQWDGAPDNSTSSAWTMTPALDAIERGPWVPGMGHSGCRFLGKPTYIANTGTNGGQVGFAASFIETGSWANG